MRIRIAYLILAAMGLGGLAAACHDPETRLPTNPSVPLFNGVDIVGPSSVPPGQSIQFAVNVRMSDGTVKGAGPDAVVLWSAIDAGAFKSTSTGLVTGLQRGEGVISADVTVGRVTRHASRSLLVMPEGTVRVVGTVSDNDAPTPPLPGVRVEVTSGDPSTLTDAAGQYRLYGVPHDSDIRASLAGYTTAVRHVSTSVNTTQNFALTREGQRPVLDGNYTLAIDAMIPCPPMPAALQHRTYDAVVTQSGSSVFVRLTEPRFALDSFGSGNQFSGIAVGNTVRFTLSWYDTYYYYYYRSVSYPSVAERLPDGTFLVPAGWVEVSGPTNALSGTMDGALVQWDSKFPLATTQSLNQCSGPLRFSLTAR